MMDAFDKVICQKFKEMQSNQKVRLNGKSKYYNNCDDVWRFQLTTCSIKGENFHE